MESQSWRSIKTGLSYVYGLQPAVLSDKWSNSPEEGGCWEWIWKREFIENLEFKNVRTRLLVELEKKAYQTTLKTGEILCLMMLTWDIAGVLRVVHWILNVKHKQVLPISFMVSGFVVHCIYHKWLSKVTSYCQQNHLLLIGTFFLIIEEPSIAKPLELSWDPNLVVLIVPQQPVPGIGVL